MFFAGVGGIGMAATANTVIQLNVPDHLRGRVLSVYTTVFAGSTPIGGLLSGAIASSFGAALAIGLGGAASLLTGLGAITWLRGPDDAAGESSAGAGERSGASGLARAHELGPSNGSASSPISGSPVDWAIA